MAFDYQSLKRLRSDSVVDNSIDTTEFGSAEIQEADLANSSVQEAELGDGSVSLSGSKYTGTLPTSKGGTGQTGLSGAYEAVTSTGSALTARPYGLRSMRVFTGNGTWSRPTDVRYIHVKVIGGGGGGSGHGEGGGCGGYSEEIIDVTSISSVGVTIGGGGGNNYYSGAGGNGGTTSFGPYLSAGGGYGANRNNQHSGGVSGSGSGGNLNIHTGSGSGHHQRSGGNSAGYWGGGSAGGHPQGGQFTYNHRNHAAPGGGGSGGHFHGNRGAIGKHGMVVVYEYY